MKNYLFLLLSIISFQTFAQTPYDDHTYQSSIKTIQFYNKNKEGSFPEFALGSSEQLLLGFDDLHAASRNFTYTVEHCDADWNSSNLSPTEYLQSFAEDRITEYRYSSNTIQKYVHYELTLPNFSIVPKLSGNYILKVFEDGDQNKPVFTRRFYVVDTKVSVGAEVIASYNNTQRQSNQKLNLQVNYGTLQVQNPLNDIRISVLQNGRTDKAQTNLKPYNYRGNQLLFNDMNATDFNGGNEFRHFDLRSLRLNSDRVGKIYRDTANTVVLLGDPNRDAPNYSFQYDNNGSFFVLNQDGRDPRTDADYVHIYFSLAGNKSSAEGSAYVVGKFNDYKLTATNAMAYDPGKGRFYTDLYLKQGVYDYEYIWVPKGGGVPDNTTFEGSYFETENDYQVLVYYRRVGGRWDELVGYRLLNTAKR